jgi:D-alanyl-D-alanine carboxypeptidase/D-alanyl-D-alanine-endopeptidase (penicillin-binding protein 4)
MKKWILKFSLAAILISGAGSFALAQETSKAIEVAKEPESVEALQKNIRELIENPRYDAAMWGVKIASLDSGKILFEHNAQKLFSPASNSKLYTMALALTRLGPEHRIKTSLYAKGRPNETGTLNSDLIIYGRGDPTISGEYNHGDVMRAFEPLVAALTNAGVKEIAGDLIGDDSFFHGAPFGAGWDWGDLEADYGAEISALTINSNTVQLLVKPGESIGTVARLAFSPPTTYIVISNRTETTAKGTRSTLRLYRPLGENLVYVTGHVPLDYAGSSEDVTMHDPAALFASLFKEALKQHGITVSGVTRSAHWLDRENAPLDFSQWSEIGAVESRPFRDIIKSIEKPSQNLYTDMMLEYVGANALGTNATGASTEAGLRELGNFLAKAGVRRGDTIFDEGSGLSRNNLTTPNATVALLTYMSRQKDFPVYYDALPIAGVDGTLRRRMKGTPAAGNVRAKTGTLRWANSVSGYMTNAVGEHLVFSMMLNRFQSPPGYERSKTADMDVILEMLAKFAVNSGAK